MAALSLLWRLTHEAAHIRHTDFSVLKAANLDPVTFNLFNCLEDWRVEKMLSGIFPGCRRNLNWLIRRFFVEQAQPRAGDDSPALAVLDYVLLTVRAWDVDEVTPARQHAASIMGGGFTQAIKEHLAAGFAVSATAAATRGIHDNEEVVRNLGVEVCSTCPEGSVPVFLTDYSPEFWGGLLRHAGLPLPHLVIAAAQDHGFHTHAVELCFLSQSIL